MQTSLLMSRPLTKPEPPSCLRLPLLLECSDPDVGLLGDLLRHPGRSGRNPRARRYLGVGPALEHDQQEHRQSRGQPLEGITLRSATYGLAPYPDPG